jgi:hypothetical protein
MQRHPIVLCAVLTLCLLGCGTGYTQQAGGPFGLHRGITPDAVINSIGHSEGKSTKADALGGAVMTVTTVPRPYPEFEEYLLIFSRKDGLLKVVAVGKDISTSAEGTELRDRFSQLRGVLTEHYSSPENIDFVKGDSDSAIAEPSNFMLSLLEKERDLSSIWPPENGAKLGDGISGIVLEALPESLDTGFLRLSYEFDGWDDYVDKLNAAQGSVL